MICPPYLKMGDRIRIVAPARKISLEELQASLNQIKAWGFEPHYSNNIFAQHHQFAGNDALRAADFQAAIDDPSCKAILCARGGYGSVRIIDQLDLKPLVQSPKWIIGYSDITVFHFALHKEGIASLHAPMPIDFNRISKASLFSLKKALIGEAFELKAAPHSFNHSGEVKAPIIGGNLSMIYSLLGSSEALNFKGKILFIEDLCEYLYHIDRMFQNLKRNGCFNDLAGIIVGSLTDMEDNKIPFGKNAEEIAKEYFKDLNIPVAFGVPAGHLDNNQSLIFGKSATLHVEAHQTIISFSNELQPETR
jgi:muramoyltetrapeptide carboxypeptidase